MPAHKVLILVFKSSIGLAVSKVANFGFCLAPYSSVCKFNVSISFSPASLFVFLKNPCCVLSPSQLFSTILFNQTGIVNTSFASSWGQLSATPFATFTKVSMPTTSAVLKVADFGLPIIGPVNASISSTFNCNFSIAFIMAIIPNTPTRLAINAGVSLQSTVVLPKYKSP